MHQFKKILVGVDVSSGERLASPQLGAATQEAVKRGTWLAKQLGGSVTFLAVLDLSAHTEEILRESNDQRATVEAAARKVVEELAQAARSEGATAEAIVVHGTPWEAITKQVIAGQHDLLLVGTRNRSSTSRFFFGSTANKLARFCPCPVWVTKPDPKFDDINMLVACDLGPEMERILHLAVGGGRLLDARVHLLHAVEYGADQGMWHAGVSHETVSEYRKKAETNAEAAIRQVLSHTDFRTLRAGVQLHIAEGDADDVILKAVKEFGIDLLVMGTKARKGIPGLFVGNTAERLLAQADCSVLIIKPDGFVSPLTAN